MQANEPLRFSINVFGARPHQRGFGPGHDAARGSGWGNLKALTDAEHPHGPVTVHVLNHQALTPEGQQLLRRK